VSMAHTPHRASPVCHLLRQQISAQLDGELDQLARMRLRVHLATCTECRRFAQELKSITLHLRRAELEAVPPRTHREWRTPLKLTVSAVVTLAAASVIAIGISHPTTNHDRPVLTSPGTQETLDGTDYDHTTHLA
jgi:anti-sigma factor RsiW